MNKEDKLKRKFEKLWDKELKERFGELCNNVIKDYAISEDELYEMIPYIGEYMEIRRNKDVFITAMRRGLIRYYF